MIECPEGSEAVLLFMIPEKGSARKGQSAPFVRKERCSEDYFTARVLISAYHTQYGVMSFGMVSLSTRMVDAT